MNKRQRVVLIVAAIVVLCMLLYPPYHMQQEGGRTLRAVPSYDFLFINPIGADIAKIVDIGLLLTQWAGVLIVSGFLYLAVKD